MPFNPDLIEAAQKVLAGAKSFWRRYFFAVPGAAISE
jgi:hypothetical protein